MLGKRMALLSLAAMTLLSFACSQTLAEASVSEEETKHIETVVDGSFFRLNLNADVAVPKEGSQIEIYTTDYARADDAKWKLMFFGSEDASVIDEWAGWDLKQNQVYYPELEHKYSAGSVFTHYDAYETGLRVDYKYIDITIWWSYSQKDAQAEGIQTSPDKAKELAQEWITRLSETIGWGDMVFNACYALPAATSGVQPGTTPDAQSSAYIGPSSTGYYIVEFRRMLGNVPVAYDQPPYKSDTAADIYGDVLQVYVDDSGVFRVTGFYRSYAQAQTETINVSLDDAIKIVQDNMDYVMFSNDDASFEITEIGLCYRLVQTLETYDKDVNACTQARPAWRFASTVNRNMTDQFIMFIDAVTGEVLP
jgi:hypothetical protein